MVQFIMLDMLPLFKYYWYVEREFYPSCYCNWLEAVTVLQDYAYYTSEITLGQGDPGPGCDTLSFTFSLLIIPSVLNKFSRNPILEEIVIFTNGKGTHISSISMPIQRKKQMLQDVPALWYMYNAEFLWVHHPSSLWPI